MVEPNGTNYRVCLVDVCGTLYDESTTAGFVRFLMKNTERRKPAKYRLLEIMRFRPFRIGLIAFGKLVGRDIFRTGYISVLRGWTEVDLSVAADSYAAYLDIMHRIDAANQRADVAAAEGRELILASNSLDVVVAAIARRRGSRWCASSLAWQGDRCAGRLALDIKGQKWAAVQRLLGNESCKIDVMVITDNKTDRDLFDVASRTVLVAKGAERSWMKGLYDELICH